MGRRSTPLQKKSHVICLGIVFTVTICLVVHMQNAVQYTANYEHLVIDGAEENLTKRMVQNWLDLRKNAVNLSKLGRILYLGDPEPRIANNSKKYQILVWKYAWALESRHWKNFSNQRINPFTHCPVQNCDITTTDASINTADIVLFHLHRMKGADDLPQGKRNPNQIWTFLTDESPYHTFLKPKVKLKEFNGVFNWSMTYRMDSDIPVPYGRTIVKPHPEQIEIKLNKRRDVLIAVLGSNCGGKNHRWDYVKELQKYITVDVYGGCGTFKTCPGHFRSDCPDINRYLFYLSFENANCDGYITEKVWWNAFQKYSIPIVMGADPTSYQMLLPPDSYINVEGFASPAVLAQFIHRLNETNEFIDYFKWRKNYEILNEHGYFQSQSFHFCRVCQALNYNNRTAKVYEELKKFWSVGKDCHPAWDE